MSTSDILGMLLPWMSQPHGARIAPEVAKAVSEAGKATALQRQRGAGNGWPTQTRSKAQAGVIIQRKANSSSQESWEQWWSEQSVLDSTAWVNAPAGQESPLQSHLALDATTLLPTPSPHHQGVPKVVGQAVHPGVGCWPAPFAPTQPGLGLQCRRAPGMGSEPWGCPDCSSSQHPSEDPGRGAAQPQLPRASTASPWCPWGQGNAVEWPLHL